ncbi:MAG TPA: c-type cytochrome [Noviherbaspirillum sp.]|nr:c-type cytochrome [Noviherbaspirillum sp.]
MRFHIGSLLAGIASALALSVSMPVAASDDATGKPSIDSEAAESLARREGCLKCHGIEKDKEGPSYKKLAARYKGKPEAEEKLLKHLRSGEVVKFSDGEEEEHRIIRSKDEGAVMNLIRWILSR